MGRPKRIKDRTGDIIRLKEYNGSHTLELYANGLYKNQQVCLSIFDGDNIRDIFQTNINELEQLIADFKKLRGIKRVRKQTSKGKG